MNIKNSVISSKTWTCNGGGAERNRRRQRDWSIVDLDAMEFRHSKSMKFDGAGVYVLIVVVQFF